MNLPTIIALSVVAAFILFVIGCVIYRKSFADIELHVPSTRLRGGEVIAPKVYLSARKDLNWGQIILAVRCLDLADRGEGANPHYEIFREEYRVSGPGTMLARDKRSFHLQIALPREFQQSNVFRAPVPLQNALDQASTYAPDYFKRNALARRSRDIRWELEVRVELEELHLTKTARLSLDVLPS